MLVRVLYALLLLMESKMNKLISLMLKGLVAVLPIGLTIYAALALTILWDPIKARLQRGTEDA